MWTHSWGFGFFWPNLCSRGLRDLSCVSLSSNHLHFYRSTECLTAVCCIERLCAKSYRGVINPDLSARVLTLSVHMCLAAIPLSHTFCRLLFFFFNFPNFIKVSFSSDFPLIIMVEGNNLVNGQIGVFESFNALVCAQGRSSHNLESRLIVKQ